jgi:hypothetical protein
VRRGGGPRAPPAGAVPDRHRRRRRLRPQARRAPRRVPSGPGLRLDLAARRHRRPSQTPHDLQERWYASHHRPLMRVTVRRMPLWPLRCKFGSIQTHRLMLLFLGMF